MEMYNAEIEDYQRIESTVLPRIERIFVIGWSDHGQIYGPTKQRNNSIDRINANVNLYLRNIDIFRSRDIFGYNALYRIIFFFLLALLLYNFGRNVMYKPSIVFFFFLIHTVTL